MRPETNGRPCRRSAVSGTGAEPPVGRWLAASGELRQLALRTAPVLGRRDVISCHDSTQFNPPQRKAAPSRFRRQAPWPLRLDVASAGDGRAPQNTCGAFEPGRILSHTRCPGVCRPGRADPIHLLSLRGAWLTDCFDREQLRHFLIQALMPATDAKHWCGLIQPRRPGD